MKIIFLHFLFVVLTWLATFFPGLDLAVAFIYCFLVISIIRQKGLGCRKVWPSCLAWQSPGLFLTGMSLIFWCWQGAASSNYDFMLQVWHLPFLPFLSLLPYREFFGVSLAYIVLHLISPFLVAVFVAYDYLFLPLIVKRQWGYHKRRKLKLGFGKGYAYNRSGNS